VLVEPLVRPEAEAAAGDDREGRAIITPLPADAPPAEFGLHQPGDGAPPAATLTLHDDGRLDGTTGSAADDAALINTATDALEQGLSRTVALPTGQYFIEAFPLRPRLVVVGAVQVAIPLVHIAKELGYETVVVDGRPAFATEARFPDVDRLIVGWPDEVAEEIGLGPNDAVAVLTHDVKFDEPAIVESLRRGARYVGAVGSKKTQADRRQRLLEAGVTPEQLAELRGPIGLDLGGRAPAETALAIMAEVVATRHNANGGPLRDKARAVEAAMAGGRDGSTDRKPQPATAA
jgi:xanthine dehydrogenase accessory factor